MTPTAAKTTCEKSHTSKPEVVCTSCCVSFAKPEKKKRSFLGFLKYHCPNCGKDIEYPLTTGYRVFYIFFVLAVGVACAKAFASGGWAMPGLFFVASVIALFIDASRRNKVRKAWEVHRSLTREGAPISTGATASSTKPIALVATVIAMAIGGILGKGIVKEIFENRDTVRFDQVLVEIAKKANATLPMQIDKETRWDTTFAGPGNRITYLFTMVNLSSGEVNPSEFCKAQKKEIINGYRTNPSMAELRKRDVELTYQYRDKNANVFATIVVSPKDFAQPPTGNSAESSDRISIPGVVPTPKESNATPTAQAIIEGRRIANRNVFDDVIDEKIKQIEMGISVSVSGEIQTITATVKTKNFNPPQFPTEFTNRAGLAYRRIKVQQAKPEGLVIACDDEKGIRRLEIINFKELSKEIQAYYGYDLNNPAAFQKRQLQLDQEAREAWEDDEPKREAAAKAEKFRRPKRNVFDEIDAERIEQIDMVKTKAENGDANFQNKLGDAFSYGWGVTQDYAQAVKWYRKSALQGNPSAQYSLAMCYLEGRGTPKDYSQSAKWLQSAAEQGDQSAQIELGQRHWEGSGGVALNNIDAYKWFKLAAASSKEIDRIMAKHHKLNEILGKLETLMTREQLARAEQLSLDFRPRKEPQSGSSTSRDSIIESNPSASGTGFFISLDGYLISNNHVVKGAKNVRLVTTAGLISAKVVKVDSANDLALLKAEGRFAAVPVAASRGVKLGGTVATVGFPNIGLQGFAPKLAKGEIASLSGAGDDARYFQISVPVQPGNSGGALVDERGNVVGVVSAKLNASTALRSSGALPENVNYAVKSSYLLSFLESVPDVASKLKEASTKEKKFEYVVKEAEQAAVLVLVY